MAFDELYNEWLADDGEEPQQVQQPPSLSLGTGATSIGPPKVGDRYVAMEPWERVLSLFMGDRRPQSVAAQDPYGLEAAKIGAGSLPLMMAPIKPVGGIAQKLTEGPAVDKLMQMLHDFTAPSADVAADMHPMDIFKQFQTSQRGRFIPPSVKAPELQGEIANQQSVRQKPINKGLASAYSKDVAKAAVADPEKAPKPTPPPKPPTTTQRLRQETLVAARSPEDLSQITTAQAVPKPTSRPMTLSEQRAKAVAEARARGEDVPSAQYQRMATAKLTVQDVKEIRAAFGESIPPKTGRRKMDAVEAGPTDYRRKIEAIAAAKGVKPSVIEDIVKRNSWAWVQ